MKKILLSTLTAMVILVFGSCTKTNSTIESKKSKEDFANKQITQILSMPQEEAKIAFNMLSNEDRLLLVQSKCQSFYNEPGLTENQRQLIKTISNRITINVYANEDEKAIFGQYIDSLMPTIAKTFSREQIVNNFYTIGKKPILRPTINETETPSTGGDCNCNIGSGYTHCDNGCNYTYQCNPSSIGCGFGFGWECNGKC